jgi:hypothetical protein
MSIAFVTRTSGLGSVADRRSRNLPILAKYRFPPHDLAPFEGIDIVRHSQGPSMRILVFMLFTAFSVAGSALPADAADVSRAPVVRPAAEAGPFLPFPRGERASRVWDARACWSACQAVCTAEEAACLKRAAIPSPTADAAPQADCIARTDSCDRSCQRECRSGAGPFLPIDW